MARCDVRPGRPFSSSLLALLALLGVALCFQPGHAQSAASKTPGGRIALSGGSSIPTGGAPSPLFGARSFEQKLLLFEEFGLDALPTTFVPGDPLPPVPDLESCPDGDELDDFLRQPLFPAPGRLSNEVLLNPWSARISQLLGRALLTGPADGRPPGEGWAHQRWSEFAPRVAFQTAQTGARTNGGLRDPKQRHRYRLGEFAAGGLYHNTTGIAGFEGTTRGIDVRFHPDLPVQDPRALWTFDGTIPPKLLQARYGVALNLRHYNALPIDPSANMGFGAHTISTHEHNGHNPAESDGYTHAFSFPGQFYDYRWPMILAGHDTVNVTASDPRAGTPDGIGGIRRIRGDWRETMSTHWFHDHMLDFTAQNVYKGNAAMMNYYSSIDRGNEAVADGINLRLPSGTALDWGNRDYDVNLLIADKAWDRQGQLWFNIFNTDGFLGDQLLTNWQLDPYLDVRARRYRFRILNGSVSRYLKIALVDQNGTAVPFHMVANDGNIMEHAVAFDGTLGTQRGILPEQGIAERYDIVVDFSRFAPGSRLYFVNLLEHEDGKGPKEQIPLSEVTSGAYRAVAQDDDGDGFADEWVDGDPCVGKFLEFRVHAYSGQDLSMNPADFTPGKRKMIPLPRPSANELANARHRTFEFGRSSGSDEKPWTIKTDGGSAFGMDPTRLSAAPNLGELSADGLGHLEIWKLSTGGGWAHPVHVHFEEGIILSRDGVPPPEWEKWARKDVYRIGDGPDSSREIEFAIRFREFAGTYMEHCHNTQHEDTAMLLRWDIERPGQFTLLPAPMPTWDGVQFVPSVSLPTARTGDGFGPGGGVEPPPPPGEVLSVTSAEYSAARGWRIRGTSTGATASNIRVRARVGPTLAGAIIGSGLVAADGSWTVRVGLSAPAPDATRTVSLESQGGATRLAVPVTLLP
jgi:FtsP/CotA-like multicopper oxidase with cupredoxin domain